MILSDQYLIHVIEIWTRTSDFYMRSDLNVNGFGINKEKGVLTKFEIDDAPINIKRELVPEGEKKHEGMEMIYLVLYSSAWLSQKTQPVTTPTPETTTPETTTPEATNSDTSIKTTPDTTAPETSTKSSSEFRLASGESARMLASVDSMTILAVSEKEIDENLKVKKGVEWWIWLIIGIFLLALLILIIVIIVCCCKCCAGKNEEDRRDVYQPKTTNQEKPKQTNYKIRDDAKTANEDNFSFPVHHKPGDSKVTNNIEEKKFEY